MKTVSKKLLSIMLVALLLVSAVPFSAFATIPHDTSHGSATGYNPTGHWTECTEADCAQKGVPTGFEAHIGDPCSVCGYTNPAATHTSAHMVSVWNITAAGHSRTCQEVGCEKYGMEVESAGHSYTNGVCSVCGYVHPTADHVIVPRPGTGSPASCYQGGKEADEWCDICHLITKSGVAVSATGLHTVDSTGHCTTPGCPYFEAGADCLLTLTTAVDVDGNTVTDATVAGSVLTVITIKENTPITNLPDPVRPGYTFAGWYIGTTRISLNQNYTFGSAAIAVPKWTENTYSLTVRRVLNGDLSTAKTILTVNVPAGLSVLDYLNTNVKATVNSELGITPGYSWDGYWRDFEGMMPLTSQLDVMNRARTIYVNFNSTGHVLYFNANGGTCSTTQKGVTFGQPVGPLPTPTKSGSVFQGWKDASGNIYTATTVYNVAGDTTLTAVWNDEALVLLRIYLNGDTTTVNRIVSMDGYVVNNNISRGDVVNVVCSYYAPMSGTSLQVAGLYDDASWASYRGNMYLAGVDNIQITNGHVNNIYVMVRNANATNGNYYGYGTGVNGSGINANGGYNGGYVYNIGTGAYTYTYNYGNGTYTINGVTYYGTNPKTGDASPVEFAAVVMIVSASALAAVAYMYLRKKRAF